MKFLTKYHKWVGIVLAFFISMFSLSGIILNHRKAFSGIDLPRSILPQEFRYTNWNNASIKGSIALSPDSILLYGGSGIWLTDSLQSFLSDFTTGCKQGTDNRIINRIVKTHNQEVYAVSTFDLYKLVNNEWSNLTHLLGPGLKERLTDIEIAGDTLVVMSRSDLFYAIYPFTEFTPLEIKAPDDYVPETSLFRTLWLLHSGELFGIVGKVFVDLLGITLIIVSVTGIIFFFSPGIIKRRKKKQKPVTSAVKTMKTSIKWHNKLGAGLLVFFLISAVSGMFLRPPLLIAIVRSKVKNIPGTVLNDPNPWKDKLRTIRYEKENHRWMLYTSSGFYTLKNFDATPGKVDFTPPVSVMGVTVLEPTSKGWLVGSFSGLYYWNVKDNIAFDCYTGKPVMGRQRGRPVSSNPISGYSGDFSTPVIFEYYVGARTFEPKTSFFSMPEQLHNGRISLWHLALEVHTGRIYNPIIGFFSELYVFFAGLLITVLIISGYLVYRRRYKVNKKRRKRDKKNLGVK